MELYLHATSSSFCVDRHNRHANPCTYMTAKHLGLPDERDVRVCGIGSQKHNCIIEAATVTL
jgi:hypothetical protein